MGNCTMGRVGVVLSAFVINGCAATQNAENTVQLASNIAQIRETQVLQNISRTVADRGAVPSQIVFGNGQATAQVQVNPVLKLPRLDPSEPTTEFDLSATDFWLSQWTVEAVKNADDLRNLRNLYWLVTSRDGDYDVLLAFFKRHSALHIPSEGPPLGTQGTNTPQWKAAMDILKAGDSIGCKLFQEGYVVEPGNLPFRRWLFWRHKGEAWLPSQPGGEPESLGYFGDWEIGVVSRDCFDDFVILVQGATPRAEHASNTSLQVPTAPLH